MRTVAWQGLTLEIEREPGAVKRLRDGHEVVQVYPYGSIAGTQGVDEDAVDVLLGPQLTAPWVYVVHQHVDGAHDEDKVLIGWQSADDARRAYERQYTPEMFGGMTVLSVADFVARLANRKRRPGKVAFGVTAMANWQRQSSDARGEKWSAEEKISTNARHRSEQFFLIAMIAVQSADGRCAWRTSSTSVALRNEPMQGEASSLSEAQRAAESAAEQMLGRYRQWAESDKSRFPGDVQIRRGMSTRAFTVPAFAFALPPAPSPTSDVWHQFAKFGVYEKDGEQSVFSPETLGQMIDNFAARRNLLSMDAEHQALNAAMNGQPAPPLAYYDALALVEGGRVTKFAARGDVKQPDGAGLADGLWGHRCEVTPLGQQLLPNYRYISPAFVAAGADEQGGPIGYDLLNVAATAIPFLDGMEAMTFYALPDGRRGVTQMADLTQRTARIGQGVMVDGIDYKVESFDTEKVTLKRISYLPELNGQMVTVRWADLKNHQVLFSAAPVGGTNGGTQAMATSAKQVSAVSAGDRVWAQGGWHVVASVEDDPLTRQKVLRFQDGGGAMVDPGGTVQVSMSAAPVGGTSGGSMNPDLMRRMGFADGAQPPLDEKLSRYARHAFSEATPEDITAMAADLDAHAEPAAKEMARRMRAYGDLKIEHEGEPDGDEPIMMDVDPSNLAQNAAIHLKTGNVHDEGGRKHSRTVAAVAAFARRHGIDPQGKRPSEILALVSAQSMPVADMNRVIDERVRAQLAAEREQAARDAQVAQLMSRLPATMPEAARAGILDLAGRNITQAEAVAAQWAPRTGAPAHVMSRMTAAGGPVGGGAQNRAEALPNAPVVRETRLGTIVEADAAQAAAARELVASTDPIVMSRVDAGLSAAERKMPHLRLMRAQNLVPEFYPHLATPRG